MTRNWTIRTRVLLLALVPATVILFVLTAFLTYLRVLETEKTLQQHGAVLVHHVARASEFGLFAGDRQALQRLAEAALQEPDVASVRILDAHAQVMASAVRAPESAGDPPLLLFVESVTQATVQITDVPLPPGAEGHEVSLGQARVELSPLGSQRAQRAIWTIALAVGAACAALAAVLAVLTADSVAGPVRKVAASIEKIADGNLAERLDPTFGGELSLLAQGVNRMAAALEASQRDLQERVAQATRELRAQKAEAEAANEAKSRFLAAASHDLRQPLHAIELLSSALHNASRGREARELCERLEEAVGSMDAMFNSLLDVYRLESGALQPRPRAFPVQDLLRSLEAEFATTASAGGNRLRLRPSDRSIVSDPILLRRVLANLISNALRYAPRGTVLVACRREGAALRIEVRDNGRGIDPRDHERIFQEFYRVEEAPSDGGKGLGLTIVARIAELLRIPVRLRSSPGRGAVFSVTVPLDTGTAPAPAAARAWPRDAQLTVLVVDDDPLVLQGTQAVTREWGLNVVTASGPQAARQELLAVHTDAVLVLCDLWLGEDQDGVALLQSLGALWPGAFYGVIVTGDSREASLRHAQDAGYPVLHKPVSAARLRATLSHYLGKAGARGPRGDRSP